MAQLPSHFGPQAQPQLFSPRQLPLMPAHVSGQDQAGENYGNQGSPQLASATPAPVGTAAHAGAPAIRGVATAASPPPQPPQWLLAPHEGQPAGFQIQELPEAAASKALPASAFGSPRCPYTQTGTRPGSSPGTSPPCHKPPCPTQLASFKLPPGWPPGALPPQGTMPEPPIRDPPSWPPGTPQLSGPQDSQCMFGSRERPGSQGSSFSNQGSSKRHAGPGDLRGEAGNSSSEGKEAAHERSKEAVTARAEELDSIQPVRPGARHSHVQISKGV